jgi:hypothetical protein
MEGEENKTKTVLHFTDGREPIQDLGGVGGDMT